MEAAERVAAGAPLGGLLGHHLLVVGLAFQVITAVAGAIVLSCVDRAIVRAVEAIRHAPVAPRSIDRVTTTPGAVVVLPYRLLAGAAGLRGPPRS
jgi:hypothetical protein